jgi:hypothetical protein
VTSSANRKNHRAIARGYPLNTGKPAPLRDDSKQSIPAGANALSTGSNCAWTPDDRVNGATLHINLDHGVAHRQEMADKGAFPRIGSEFDHGRRRSRILARAEHYPSSGMDVLL